ncbi:MAG: radical SAM protein [Gammaproteobacteria bacterium]|nr:radical SAM protein [Gammaproteobacteria bacterium]
MVIITANPIPGRIVEGSKKIFYPFGPYLELKNASPGWYEDNVVSECPDLALIPYPLNILSGYANVRQFVENCGAKYFLELGCGGNWSLKSRVEYIESINTDDSRIGSVLDCKPSYVTINITEHCNLRCVMCDIDDDGDYPHMPLEEFSSVSKQLLNDCRILTLNGFVGEPLLHPNFTEIIQLLDEQYPHLSVGFATNATAFSEKRIKTILNSRVIKDLRISLSSARKETYEKVMVRAKYDDTLKKLKRFMDLRSRMENGSELVVTFSFVAMQQNIGELPQFVRFAGELGVDQVLVWDLQLSQESNLNYTLHKNNIDVSTLLDEARSVALEEGVNLVLPGRYGLDKDATIESQISENTFRCLLPWSHVYVSPNGDVAPCCFFNKKMGNLLTDSSDEIWNNNSYQVLRNDIESGNYPMPCLSCPENRNFKPNHPQIVMHKNRKGGEVYIKMDNSKKSVGNA